MRDIDFSFGGECFKSQGDVAAHSGRDLQIESRSEKTLRLGVNVYLSGYARR
jgi:hypothetical protein